MARNSANLTITARVDDRASAPLKEIGKTAGSMAQGFSKSTAAIQALSVVTGGMGSKVTDTAGKLVDMASLLAVGGPFGLAFAGITAAVTAGTYAWGLYSDEMEEAKKKTEELKRAEEEYVAVREKGLARIVALESKLMSFGRDRVEMEIEEASAAVTLSENRLAALEQEAKHVHRHTRSLERRSDEFRESGEAARAEIAARIDREKQVLDEARQTLELLEMQRFQEREAEREREVQAAAEAKRADVKRARDDEQREADRRAEAESKERHARLMAFFAQAESTKTTIHAANLARRIAAENDSIESHQKAEEAKVAAAQSAASEQIQIRAAIGAFMADSLASITTAAITAEEGQKEAAIMSAVAQVAAALATAAAKAFAAHAGIPFIGPALGAVAAAAIVAGIKQFSNGFATGGIVEGGTPGKDSVPILAQQGEAVIPVGMVRSLRRVLGASGPAAPSTGGGMAFASGGTVPASRGGHGAGIVINQTIRSVIPATTEFRRGVREVARDLRVLGSRNMAFAGRFA